MKPWQWGLVGLGTIVAVYIVVEIATPAAQLPVMVSGPTGVPDTGNATERAVSGGFGLARELLGGVLAKVSRDDAAREAQRNRDAAGTGKGAADPVDANYNPALALAEKNRRA